MRAPALRYRRMLTVMANRNAEYLQQIVDMQKQLHDREKRRHELEEQLFSYLRSEERLTKMQCAKMLCYYKELGERERQAKTRNLELLRNVESLAGKLKEFSVDCSRLLHKRREYKNHITKLKEDGKKVESRGESEAYEQPNRFLLPGMRGSSQSAVAFVGHSSVKVGITSTHSPARTEPVPNHPSFSPQQSALSIHERISNTGNVPFLSDDILNSGVCPEGACVSDMHDCQIESDSDISQREGEPKGWEDLDLASKKAEVSSRSVTLKIPAAVVSLEGCPTRSPLPDIADPRDPSQNRSSRGENEVLSAEEESGSALGNDVLSDHSKSRYPSIPNPAVESRPKPSVHKHTDISVFTNQSNLNSRGDDKGRVQNQSGILDDIKPPNRFLRSRPLRLSNDGTSCCFQRSRCVVVDLSTNPLWLCLLLKKRPALKEPVMDPVWSPLKLCMEGFCHLLDVIERRLCAKDINIYHHCTVNEQKLRHIISICRQRGLLDDVDLQICGAVVLQQLPLLCCSLPQRCLLPADLIHTHWSSARKPEHIRLCLSAEGASLWDRCFSHMLHLQNQNVLSTDVTVQIFTPLLVLNNATYTDKAGELLKRLLTYESDTHQPSESERSSSCSLPSLLDDSVEIKAARPSQRYSPVAGTPEIQSAEEDSADQSPVESIPIRETKAYQLLKQTVAQERHPSDTVEEDSESSDVSKSQRADVLPDSITQNSRKSFKSKANTFSAVQSKAFWGESDDSEIEMALRPQSRTSGANDSDDFYD